MHPLSARQALKRPLQFGDTEQIAALKVLYPPLINEEGKTRYRVDISVDYSDTVYVYAADIDEAIEMARADLDLGECDIDCRAKEVGE
jgi:hypothetical protein